MEQCFQANKEIEELQKLQLRKHHKATEKYQNVSAKVITSFREKKKRENDNNNDSVPKSDIESALSNKTRSEEQRSRNEIGVMESDKKYIAATKKTVRSEINNSISDKLKKRNGTGKCKNQQKLQSKVSSDPSLLHKSDSTENYADSQNVVKYRSQGIQTLDTDQTESIYSEGIIL